MKHLLLILALLYVHTTYAQTTLSQGIDKLLKDIPSDGPGVAIGVYQDGQLLISKKKGLANIGLQVPITTASNFNLASISKQFTAACIIHLLQENKLELSDPISTYLPMLQGDLKSVTIQQLLNHTSGIRDYMSLLVLKQSDQVDFFNNFIGEERHLYDLMSKQKNLEFEPGTEHRYSNTNYWLLGQIVSASSDMSLGAYAKKHIFEPLQMDHTEYQENSGRIVENRAMGHVLECPECEIFEYNHRTTSVGAGGLLSNIDDLLKWENEFYNHEVLTVDSWKIMTTPATLKNGQEIEYACGLIVGKHKGYDIIQHSGQDPGFVNMLLKFPDQKLSIAVLGNFTWYDEIGIAFSISDLILDDIQSTAENISPEVPEAIELSKSALEKFCAPIYTKKPMR